ncbi:transposase, partial [Aliarcobacter cryaerophilus]|uniref:IS1634 family transposase n=1 Tax=Aliarcobacter cryaerophilus TaxID=28198 RepID=UPI003DA6BEE8
PQIQLGLFTTLQGYPLSYEVYEGNKFEGHTLVDILKKFQEKFNLSLKPVVVADRGMLNNDNLAYLETNGYKYIIAAKIKNISNELKEEISNLSFIDDSTIHTININKELIYKEQNEEINLKSKKRVHKKSLDIKQRLILSYSSKRAKKDKYTREKAIEKIQSKISKNITKSDLKLSYYAKYLDIDNTLDIKYRLNPKKIVEDEKLDGIKGFITNDFTLNPNEIIQHY